MRRMVEGAYEPEELATGRGKCRFCPLRLASLATSPAARGRNHRDITVLHLCGIERHCRSLRIGVGLPIRPLTAESCVLTKGGGFFGEILCISAG